MVTLAEQLTGQLAQQSFPLGGAPQFTPIQPFQQTPVPGTQALTGIAQQRAIEQALGQRRAQQAAPQPGQVAPTVPGALGAAPEVAGAPGAIPAGGGGFGATLGGILESAGSGIKPTSTGFEAGDFLTAALSSFAKSRESIREREKEEKERPRKERFAELEERKFEAEVGKLEREAAGGADPTKLVEQEQKVRKEFTGLSKNFFLQRDAFSRVQASAIDPSPAGDLALIFNFMKVLDPGSTVREGEFATAANSASVPERVRAQWNKAIEGERLSDKTRKDFVNRSERLFAAADSQHTKNIQTFSDLSERSGLDPQNVVIDLGLAEQQAQVEEVTQETQDFTALSDAEIRKQIEELSGQAD